MEITVAKKRIDSIDILRGIIMVIMALDHVRDFFHIDAMTGNPTDPATTTPALFFTRWITHFCAPVFVFLAGTSAFLAGQKKTKKELSVFLLTRGIWLVVIDIIVFGFLLTFDPLFHTIGTGVVFVSGVSMILLAALIYLPLPVLFALGLILVGLHNMLDAVNTKDGLPPLLWSLLHQPSFRPISGTRNLLVFYPLIPWPGIMLLGYCMGVLFVREYDAAKRRKRLLRIGFFTTVFFFVMRWINVYGDLFPWSAQATSLQTVFSYFNLTKYPPSLLYFCMTIGPALIVLAWIEQTQAKWTQAALVYGRVPMFYYLLHFLVIHTLCMIFFFATGHNMSQATEGFMIFRPNAFGYSLPVVYALWIAIVAALYPLCKKYSRYKATHNNWWLPYL